MFILVADVFAVHGPGMYVELTTDQKTATTKLQDIDICIRNHTSILQHVPTFGFWKTSAHFVEKMFDRVSTGWTPESRCSPLEDEIMHQETCIKYH